MDFCFFFNRARGDRAISVFSSFGIPLFLLKCVCFFHLLLYFLIEWYFFLSLWIWPNSARNRLILPINQFDYSFLLFIKCSTYLKYVHKTIDVYTFFWWHMLIFFCVKFYVFFYCWVFPSHSHLNSAKYFVYSKWIWFQLKKKSFFFVYLNFNFTWHLRIFLYVFFLSLNKRFEMGWECDTWDFGWIFVAIQ